MLDSLDIKILNILQSKGRAKRKDIAEKVGLSLPSLSERLNKLEDKGVIKGYYAKLDRRFFDYDIMAYIFINMESSKYYDQLISNVSEIPQIIECHSVLGEGSHILKIVAKNTEVLENLLSTIQSWKGVSSTKTTFVLSTIKETTSLKL